jgi:hypothetical protein
MPAARSINGASATRLTTTIPAFDLLVAAIRLRLVVHLRYDWGHRVVEPHVYGLTREGHELLRAFQVGGHSESGRPFGWKLFRVDEIENVHLPGKRFKAPRRGYKRVDPAISRIFAQL